MENTIKNLYKQLIDLNAGEAHMTVEKIYEDEKANAVISVYHGQRPSHSVLEELYEWADENGHSEVMTKIETLSEMEENE